MRIPSTCGFLPCVLLLASFSFGAQSTPDGAPPPPDHLTLFKLYMAANADVLEKDDQAAWEYYLLFKIPAGPQGGISQQCTALNMQLQNEITAQKLLNEARTEFKKTLAQTSDWPTTAVVRITSRASLNPYDAATGSFPVVPMGALLMLPPNATVQVPRDPARQLGTDFTGPVKAWCPAMMRAAGTIIMPPRFALDITGNEPLQSVPMSASAAEAYLTSHPNRDVRLEAIVEVGSASIRASQSQYIQGSIPIAARVLHLRAVDPASGQTIHQYAIAGSGSTAQAPATVSTPTSAPASPSVSKPAATTLPTGPANRPATSTSPDGAPAVALNSYRGFLLTVRDNAQVASQAALLPPTLRQVLAEQKAWTTIQGVLDHAAKTPQYDQYKLNPKRKTFIYEWQTEADTLRPDLVDVFLRTDADWSFVTRDPQWDTRFGAIVDAFLFARKSVEGREASFAAQELVPVYKRHLDAAVAKAPTNLFLSLAVPAGGYDFASKSIRFLQPGTVVHQKRPYEGGIDLLPSTDDPKMEDWVLPPKARSTATYSLFGAVQSMHRADLPSTKPGTDIGSESPTQSWRSYFSIGSSSAGEGENIPYIEVLALDRQLRLSSIPLDPAKAEKLAKAGHYATMGTMTGLTAKAYFAADRVELSHRTWGGTKARYGVLFAKLQRIDILGPDNEVLASFAVDSLPPPAARSTTTTPVPPKPAASKAGDTLGERQAEIDKKVTAHTASIVADLKKKAEAEQANATAQSQAASQAAAQSQGAPKGPSSDTPAGPAWQPCGGDLRSGASQTAVPVEFVNTSKQPRKLIWFDFAGARITAGVLQPGQRAPMQTYTTHAWMIADASGQCMGTLVISKAGSIEIR